MSSWPETPTSSPGPRSRRWPRSACAGYSSRGDPTLLGRFAAAGCLDELCLTWSPLLVGGDGPRIAHGPLTRQQLRAAHLVEADGLLLGRWLVMGATRR